MILPPLHPAPDILLNTDRSSVFSPAFPSLSLIFYIYSYLPSLRIVQVIRQDNAASSGAIIANTRIPAIMQATILLALVLLKFILTSIKQLFSTLVPKAPHLGLWRTESLCAFPEVLKLM